MHLEGEWQKLDQCLSLSLIINGKTKARLNLTTPKPRALEKRERAQESQRIKDNGPMAQLLWFGSRELDCASCFSKVPKYDKPLLRRIFRRGTNNNTISKT